MLNEVLRVIRVANDITISELSKKSSVSKSYITEVEKGKKNPSNAILEKISSSFNLEVSDLFELDKYHDSIVDKKEKLECYRLLLIKVLEVYEKSPPKVSKRKK